MIQFKRFLGYLFLSSYGVFYLVILFFIGINYFYINRNVFNEKWKDILLILLFPPFIVIILLKHRKISKTLKIIVLITLVILYVFVSYIEPEPINMEGNEVIITLQYDNEEKTIRKENKQHIIEDIRWYVFLHQWRNKIRRSKEINEYPLLVINKFADDSEMKKYYYEYPEEKIKKIMFDNSYE